MNFEDGKFESFELLRLGLIICDRRGCVKYINTSAQFLLGQSAKIILGSSVTKIIEGASRCIEAYSGNPDPTYLVQDELTEMLRPPLEPVKIFATCHPMPDQPEYLIIEAEPAGKTLQTAHERHMNELSENSRRLLRNLAHEIKNPLGGIRGAAQLLEGELENSEQKEYTMVIISEADRLQLLVDKILAPYRQSYKPAKINIHEILEQVRLLIHSEFPEIQVVRDYDISTPEILGDRGQLTQMSLNLMRNAAEALNLNVVAGDAKITLKTRVVHHVLIGDEIKRTALNIHVIDNGEGIPKSIAESIFYPLVSGKEKGTGLGLSLVQSFVERHGGTINVTSKKGRTDFSIYFPLEVNPISV